MFSLNVSKLISDTDDSPTHVTQVFIFQNLLSIHISPFTLESSRLANK